MQSQKQTQLEEDDEEEEVLHESQIREEFDQLY